MPGEAPSLTATERNWLLECPPDTPGTVSDQRPSIGTHAPTPDSADAMPGARIDSAPAKALARAGRIGRSCVSRALGRALLAPDLVEAVLDVRRGEAVALEALLGGLPAAWREQDGMKGVRARCRQPAPFRSDAACSLNERTLLIAAPRDR